MWNRLTTLLADKSRWIAVVCLCSTIIPVYWLRDAHIDNSIEVWIGTRGEAHDNYQRFLEKYGNEEFVVIAGEAQDPLSDDALAFQDKLASRLRQIDRVDGVLDIAQAAAAFKKFRPEDWKESLGGNGLFRNLLLGRTDIRSASSPGFASSTTPRHEKSWWSKSSRWSPRWPATGCSCIWRGPRC